MRLPPFTVYPVEFELGRNESVDITIEYVPLTLGEHSREFIALCDNEQTRTFRITAVSKQVDIHISEINSGPVDEGDATVCRDLCFPACFTGSETVQQFVVANRTGLPIEYEWVWVEPKTSDLRKAGVAQLNERQREEAERQRRLEARGADYGDLPVPPEVNKSGSERPVPGASKGLRDSLMHSLSFEVDSPRNAVEKKGFELHPARGILAGDGIEDFRVTYKPEQVGHSHSLALLMLKGVPGTGLKELSGGEDGLRKLLEKGHGSFVKLCSWLEDIGDHIAPEVWRASEPDRQVAIINLKILLSMAADYAASEVDRLHMVRIGALVRMLLDYVMSLLKNEARAGADDNTSQSSSIASLAGSRVSRGGSTSRKTTASIVYWDPASDVDPVWVPPYKLGSAALEEYEESDGLGALTEEQDAVLSKMYADTSSCLKLLGTAVCAALDAKVKHEAVDYIQSICRSNLPCLTVNVSGESKPQRIAVSPPITVIGGALSVGKPWTGKVTIKNLCNVLTDVDCFSSDVIIRSLGISSTLPKPSHCNISIEPSHVILMPDASEEVEITVTIFVTGYFQLNLPLKPSNKSSLAQDIVIMVRVIAPRLHFESPEVDFGLIGVGQVKQASITFSNEGDVNLKYAFAVIPDNEKDHTGSPFTRGSSSFSRGLTRAPSDTSSIGGSDAFSRDSRDGTKVESPIATLLVEPSTGELGPGQTTTVQVVCTAGKFPQRVRGILECSLFEKWGLVSWPSQYVSYRGEVQSPKVLLSPLVTDLGNVFVGTPVKFEVTLRNLSNLVTKFKFDRPGGESPNFRLTFDQSSGSLDPKSVRKIEAEYVALNPGVTDELIGCKVQGSQQPLGFVLKGVSSGALLEYVSLKEGESPPKPLGKPTDAQYRGDAGIPDPAPITPLLFGHDVNLYERRTLRLAIRNLSAVSTSFEVYVKKFADGVDSEEDIEEMNRRKDSRKKRAIGVLQPREDGENVYHSEAGKKYICSELLKEEDRLYLSAGLGAAYHIDCKHGKLRPWEVKVLTIKAFNDMPGCFDDELIIEVRDQRKVSIPIKMTVHGCPVQIEKGTVGMTILRGSSDMQNQQVLQLGYASVNSDPLVRSFRVRNNGSMPAQVRWKIRGVAAKVNGPLKFEVRPLEKRRSDGKLGVSSKILFWDDVARSSPFTIEPTSAVIPAGGRRSFNVTLSRSTQEGTIQAILSARAEFDVTGGSSLEDGDEITISSASTVNYKRRKTMISGEISSRGGYTLCLLVQGTFEHPTLRLNESIVSACRSITELPSDSALTFVAQATTLFAKNGKKSDVCSLDVTLTNPSFVTLTFGASVEGSFSINSRNNESLKMALKGDEALPNNESSLSLASASLGKTFQLPPSVSISLKFINDCP